MTTSTSSPAKVFRELLLQALLGLTEHDVMLPDLNKILQATVDASLLWLVRRFAEDSNDSVELVQTIALFTTLVERVAGDTRFSVQLKKSLVDRSSRPRSRTDCASRPDEARACTL